MLNNPNPRTINPEKEPYLEVDLDSRIIHIPECLLNIGVANDNNAETIFLKTDRYFDDVDLSKCNALICFTNARKEYYKYQILTEGVSIDTTSILLPWTISDKVTKAPGEIQFTLLFETDLSYQLQTRPAFLNVLAGLDILYAIENENTTLFEDLSKRLELTEDDLIETKENLIVQEAITNSLENLTNSLNENLLILQEKIDYLQSNVVYKLD